MTTAPLSFASAYRQLRPSEKAFVDSYVARVESEANRANERISNALYRPIPADIVEASRGMLDIPLVRAAIAERINDKASESELTVHRVIKELMGVAFASIGDYFEVDALGEPVFDLTKCTPEQLAAIESVEIEESAPGLSRPSKKKIKIKLHNKLRGIEMLAQYMGLLERDNPHWRADQARPVSPTLPAAATVQQAGDRYSAMING